MTPTMMVHFRRAAPSDAASLIAVRSATSENPFSVQALAEAGITPGSVAEGLERATLAGWVAETRDELIGFCLADLPKGELWVLAVLPRQEGRGVGRELLIRTEELLWRAGRHSIWLWTSPDRTLRAHRLYVAAGWSESGVSDGRLFMRKTRD